MPFEGPTELKMSRVRSSIRRYRDKVTNKMGVSEWLVPKKVMQERLTGSNPEIRGEIAKTIHNRGDFQLKVKPYIYRLLGKNGIQCRFDYLKSEERLVLNGVVSNVYHNFTSTN
jgi:hypothetical protein